MTRTALSLLIILISFATLIPMVIGDHLGKGSIRYWLDGQPVACPCIAHRLWQRRQTHTHS